MNFGVTRDAGRMSAFWGVKRTLEVALTLSILAKQGGQAMPVMAWRVAQ
jgi:hypothetical protein